MHVCNRGSAIYIYKISKISYLNSDLNCGSGKHILTRISIRGLCSNWSTHTQPVCTSLYSFCRGEYSVAEQALDQHSNQHFAKRHFLPLKKHHRHSVRKCLPSLKRNYAEQKNKNEKKTHECSGCCTSNVLSVRTSQVHKTRQQNRFQLQLHSMSAVQSVGR